MEQISQKEQELIRNPLEKTRLQNEINEIKGKIADEVNATLTAEIGPIPRLTAQIELKNIQLPWFSSSKK